MKFLILSFVFLFTLPTAMQSQSNLTSTNKPKNLRHVVLFKFKDASSAEDIKKVETAFGVLPSKISQIKGYEWGTNNSPENHNEGFTHSFVLTFTSEADRDAYLIHPEHKAFGKVLGPHLDKVLVIDFWAMN
ncbi:MAG: Dabb family protein [Saprospiraceae bacterium]|nr:Dabb family protein [Saprospiraceae bacterium]MBK8779282.1 Dabb family protein [Saprospiraceae bacterium]MBK9681700.1 Dabb family protein [Saprospiraceae bacterium]MBK9928646.1 Dabb family protein [Saprospiraceae bacterium]